MDTSVVFVTIGFKHVCTYHTAMTMYEGMLGEFIPWASHDVTEQLYINAKCHLGICSVFKHVDNGNLLTILCSECGHFWKEKGCCCIAT